MDIPTHLPAQGAPDTLVILLHGYGADGHDLISLSSVFRPLIPQAVFLSPHSPALTPFGGHQWFPLSTLSPEEIAQGAEKMRPWVENFIDTAVASYKIPPSRVFLGGFSQGCMMSLAAGLRRRPSLLGVLGFSGALPGGAQALDGVEGPFPPVFLAHGTDDSVVPVSATVKAAEILTQKGIEVSTHFAQGSPHTIEPDSLKAAVHFMASCLERASPL